MSIPRSSTGSGPNDRRRLATTFSRCRRQSFRHREWCPPYGPFASILPSKASSSRAAKSACMAIEQYRRLAAVLHDLRLQNGPKTLTVSELDFARGQDAHDRQPGADAQRVVPPARAVDRRGPAAPVAARIFGSPMGRAGRHRTRGRNPAAMRRNLVMPQSPDSGHAVANPLAI